MYTLTESKRYPGLFIKKYKKAVFYNNLWTPELLECRGHVYKKDGTLVISPFTKVFNVGEGSRPRPNSDAICLVVEKINGFMAALTYVDGYGVVVSTTGSLDSKHVDMAKEKIPNTFIQYMENLKLNSTFIFEIVHEDDPHIIKHDIGAYLIGMRFPTETTTKYPYHSSVQLESLLDVYAETFGFYRPLWYPDMTFAEISKISKTCKHEGFMLYFEKEVLKLKTPYYLATKALARSNDILSLDKSRIDEEFYPLQAYLATVPGYKSISEQSKLGLMRDWLALNNR